MNRGDVPITAAAVLEYLRSQASRPLDLGELAERLHVDGPDRAALETLLSRLVERGDLYPVKGRRYAVPERINLAVGRLMTTRRGAGFVVPDGAAPHIYVPPDELHSAQDGDRVVVRLERGRSGQKPEGHVIRVLDRARETVVGTFHARGGGREPAGYVVPEDRRLRWDVVIPPGATAAAEEGQVVVVRIADWGGATRGPTGEVERILGRLGEPGVDVEAIIHGHELPTEFPPAVEAAAAALATRGVAAADLSGREDLRDVLVFTIDPADAKDHDDALSIRSAGEGMWEVGIHIADVSHYVREGEPLDLEASRRGTSIYLVDRVLPMLPHPLSSDLCSLVPGRDRLTLSLLLVLDAQGGVQAQRLVRGVIRSRHKLAYEQAQALLDAPPGQDELATALHALLALSQRLRAGRKARGSIDFDVPEARVLLDAVGSPMDVQRVERLESHRLIEDFMLLANETIARGMSAARMPFVYRVHEKPEEGRLDQLREFAASLGYRLGDGAPGDLQRLLGQAAGRPDEALIATVVLRSMQLARYSATNLGHFGLAAAHYTHFTSPIRRYPDLVVHRLAAARLIDRQEARITVEALEEVAAYASARERVATAAERDSIELKKVEFMQRHLGDDFEGTVSNVRAFGFFVLLDAYYVEGLVHVSSLEDDYYRFLEDQYALAGEHTGRRFRVGDRVRVVVSAVDLEERQIDFLLAERPARRGGRTARRRP